VDAGEGEEGFGEEGEEVEEAASCSSAQARARLRLGRCLRRRDLNMEGGSLG
jgi:hypothetical protein